MVIMPKFFSRATAFLVAGAAMASTAFAGDNDAVISGTQILPQFQFSNSGVEKALGKIMDQEVKTNNYSPTFEVVAKAFKDEGVENALPVYKMIVAQAKGVALAEMDYAKNTPNPTDYGFASALLPVSYAAPALHPEEMGKELFRPGSSPAEQCLKLAAAGQSWATFGAAKSPSILKTWGMSNILMDNVPIDKIKANIKATIDNPNDWAVEWMHAAITTDDTLPNGDSKRFNLNIIKEVASRAYNIGYFSATIPPAKALNRLIEKNPGEESQALYTALFSPVLNIKPSPQNPAILAFNGGH